MNEHSDKPESEEIPQPTPPREPTPMTNPSDAQEPAPTSTPQEPVTPPVEATPAAEPVQETAPPPEFDPSAPPIPPQSEPQGQTPTATAISQDSKNLGMLCHLLGLFTNFLGPLILWLIKKDEDAFVDDQGKEALNFQITVAIASFVSGLLIAACIGPVLLAGIWVCNIVFCIMACMAANKGENYRYPWCLRLVK